MAQEWGTPPWEIREKLTAEDYNRWAITKDELNQFQEKERKKAEQKAKRK